MALMGIGSRAQDPSSELLKTQKWTLMWALGVGWPWCGHCPEVWFEL